MRQSCISDPHDVSRKKNVQYPNLSIIHDLVGVGPATMQSINIVWLVSFPPNFVIFFIFYRF